MTGHFHHVPGRLRIHVPRIKGSLAQARAVESSISEIKGIYKVEAREVTGSVVVYYDPKTIDPESLMPALGSSLAIGCAGAALRPETRSAAEVISAKLAQAVICQILEMAAERAVPLLISALL